MKLDEIFSPRDRYIEPLEAINGIKFTQKQIDVIACLISGRTNKVIASILSIGDKAIEHRISGIISKLNCNRRQGIIDFIQTSGKADLLRSYGLFLQKHNEFEKCLAEISKLKPEINGKCLIIHWNHKNLEDSFLAHFKEHLELAGLSVSIKTRKKHSSFLQLIKESRNDNYVIYMLPEILWEETEANLKKRNLTVQNITEAQHNCLFLLSRRESDKQFTQMLSGLDYIDIAEQNHYFSMVFEILKRFFPPEKVEHIVSKAKMLNETTESPINIAPPKVLIQTPHSSFFFYLKAFSKKKAGVLLLMLSFIGLGGTGFFIFGKSLEKQTHQKAISIRSDLDLPVTSFLLNRPELLSQINKQLKEQDGIKTIALIGMGGAGKTTLARQYAQSQNLPIVWEINAETRGNLKESFEKLAEALAKTEDDKKTLRGLQEIKDSKEKEEKVIQFVKERLRIIPNWFLVYDNVEKLKDIRSYFPNDPKTWGKGTALITTRDSNILNDSHIRHSILIGELEARQKMDLFLKIINHGQTQNLIPVQQKEIRQFLEKIPPFPLDVSVAAYYIKSTSIPYEKYLTYIDRNSNDFEAAQHNILKETNDSAKTRYGIIALSLQKLIEAHKDFQDFLLLISLINSQNIPRDLLVKYKNDLIVDQFIFHLKKYSLIRVNSLTSSPALQTISLHRSTQAMSLAYLRKKLELEKNKEPIHQISNVLEKYLAEAMEKNDVTQVWNLHTHLVSFLNYKHLLSAQDIATLKSELGYIESYFLKDNIKAKKNLDESYLLAKQHFDENDSRIGKILVYLGIVSRRLGQYEKAKELLQQGLNIYKKHFPEDHPKVRWALASLGNIYRILGNPEQSKILLEQALGDYNTSIFQNKEEHARTLAYLGVTYMDIGDYKKSQEFLNKSLHIHKTYFHSMHPDITWILSFLGDTYRKLEDYKKAIDILEEGLSLQKKYFPYNSNENNWFIFLLGKAYRELGEYQKARSFIEQALAYYKENFGKEHVDTAYAMRSLGQIYFLEGHLEEAENLFRQALQILQKKNSSDQYMVLENLAEINLKKFSQETYNGNTKASQRLKANAKGDLEKALQIVRAHFPENSLHRKRIQEKLSKLN